MIKCSFSFCEDESCIYFKRIQRPGFCVKYLSYCHYHRSIKIVLSGYEETSEEEYLINKLHES